MDNERQFYTLKGYQAKDDAELTPAMEDYLEMIVRILQKEDVVRIGRLAGTLNVKPPSATKMIQQLTVLGYVDSEKYGYVKLTGKGRAEGEYLIHRHKVLSDFLCLLNGSDTELEQVEKIEHFMDRGTIDNLEALTARLRDGGGGGRDFTIP